MRSSRFHRDSQKTGKSRTIGNVLKGPETRTQYLLFLLMLCKVGSIHRAQMVRISPDPFEAYWGTFNLPQNGWEAQLEGVNLNFLKGITEWLRDKLLAIPTWAQFKIPHTILRHSWCKEPQDHQKVDHFIRTCARA